MVEGMGAMKRLSELRGRRSESGFTLIELLITLTITVAIMTVVLTAVDINANITRVQSDVSDLQQSTRVAQRDMQRLVRMVGRGGLPHRPSALGVQDTHIDLNAVVVDQNTTDLVVGGEDVVDGTDILTIRGALTSPVFRIDSSDPATFQPDGNGNMKLQIDSITTSAFAQPLSTLHALTPPEAILLVGSQGDAVYAVVEMTDIVFDDTVTIDVQNESQEVERATLTLAIAPGSSPHIDSYLQLSSQPGSFPGDLTSVLFASVLEEYKLFIREDFTIPDDTTSRPTPKLARARMHPGTDVLHPDGVIDVADNVYDLQVALGVDLDRDGRIEIEDESGAPLATNADEWLWNGAAEDTSLAWDTETLQHLRLTIVGQAQTADRQYISPALTFVEDHEYNEDAAPTGGAEVMDRRYRRRMLQSTIDLRNL
jgi:prepilin-type N-terminal cleavage/methylation domain-containing protein